MSDSLLLSAQKWHLAFFKKTINFLSSWTAVIFSGRAPLRGVFGILIYVLNICELLCSSFSHSFSSFPVSTLQSVYLTCSSFFSVLLYHLCYCIAKFCLHVWTLHVCSYATWTDCKATTIPVLGLFFWVVTKGILGDLLFCWTCVIVYQYNEISVMQFSFNLLRIKCLYKYRALLALPLEVLHQRHLLYCVSVMSVGNIPGAVCVVPPEDEQIMLETCRGSWFWINWMKSASRWFHYTDILREKYQRSKDPVQYICAFTLKN
jgi:hypothetical protein